MPLHKRCSLGGWVCWRSHMPPPPEGDDEAKRLSEAKQIVKQEAFRMKRALDQRNLRDALKHASTMLSELRTSLLGPRNYYDLYITATDELRHMEAFFEAEQKRGRRMLELYELVQVHPYATPPLRPAPCALRHALPSSPAYTFVARLHLTSRPRPHLARNSTTTTTIVARAPTHALRAHPHPAARGQRATAALPPPLGRLGVHHEQGGAVEGRAQGPGRDVPRRAAPDAWALPAQLPLADVQGQAARRWL